MNLNVGVGPHATGNGWVDIDLVHNTDAGIVPDVVGTLAALPFADGSARRVYAGHCLEHIPLGGPFDAAMTEVRRVLAADGVAVFVCPDVYRALEWWKDGRAPWSLVDACLEGPDGGIDPSSAWDGCFHAWNCHQDRLRALVATVFPGAVAVPMDSSALDGFPVVSRAGWQCAVITRPA